MGFAFCVGFSSNHCGGQGVVVAARMERPEGGLWQKDGGCGGGGLWSLCWVVCGSGEDVSGEEQEGWGGLGGLRW